MNTTIQTRTATVDDLPVLLAFEQGIVEAERPFNPSLKPGHINYYDIKALILSDTAEVIVATFEDQIIASGYVKKMVASDYFQYDEYAYLGFMYVDPDHRGKGVNRIIIEALERWAKDQGISEICLEVYVENKGAIRAYEKVGFQSLTSWMRKKV